MITLPVDESFAFDFLAILAVKAGRARDIGMSTWDPNETVFAHIRAQVGDDKFQHIIHSDEFVKMLDVNMVVFQAVDMAKRDHVKASTVDDLNFQRHLAKKALQARFFPDTPMTEVKIGYDKS